MIFDLHNDFATKMPETEYADYLSTRHGVTVTAALFTTELPDARHVVAGMTSALKRVRGHVPIAIEDIGFTAKDELYKSFEFSEYKYCSLTWNYNNAFAGGALDDGDLTDRGKAVVRLIGDSGCAVDVAHLNKQSFYSVLGCVPRVLCSHTGFNAHPRSLDKDQISSLIELNAVIGLSAVTAFTGAATLVEFVDVLDRFVQRYGDKNLALGTDFYGTMDLPADMHDYKDLERARLTFSKRGYTSETTDRIFYNNANDFFS